MARTPEALRRQLDGESCTPRAEVAIFEIADPGVADRLALLLPGVVLGDENVLWQVQADLVEPVMVMGFGFFLALVADAFGRGSRLEQDLEGVI